MTAQGKEERECAWTPEICALSQFPFCIWGPILIVMGHLTPNSLLRTTTSSIHLPVTKFPPEQIEEKNASLLPLPFHLSWTQSSWSWVIISVTTVPRRKGDINDYFFGKIASQRWPSYPTAQIGSVWPVIILGHIHSKSVDVVDSHFAIRTSLKNLSSFSFDRADE